MKNCLIICWYGKLPDYFNFWEKSSSYNKKYDFIIFTDQDYKSKYENIKIYKKSLEEMNKLISKKLNLKINIEKPYKFCDLRPAFGVIFEDYIKDYNFWGYCDLDQIFGDIDKFITEDILKKYEKINKKGHFCLIKNNKKMNNLYKIDKTIYPFYDIFVSKENFAFDEESGIDRIAHKCGIKCYCCNEFADIDVKYSRFKICHLKNYEYQLFSFEKGKLYRYFLEDNNIKKDELMYLHFQKKHPLNIDHINEEEKFLINKQGFEKFEPIKNRDIIVKHNGSENKKEESIEKKKYIKLKISQFLKSTMRKKKIWIKQKILKVFTKAYR